MNRPGTFNPRFGSATHLSSLLPRQSGLDFTMYPGIIAHDIVSRIAAQRATETADSGEQKLQVPASNLCGECQTSLRNHSNNSNNPKGDRETSLYPPHGLPTISLVSSGRCTRRCLGCIHWLTSCLRLCCCFAGTGSNWGFGIPVGGGAPGLQNNQQKGVNNMNTFAQSLGVSQPTTPLDLS